MSRGARPAGLPAYRARGRGRGRARGVWCGHALGGMDVSAYAGVTSGRSRCRKPTRSDDRGASAQARSRLPRDDAERDECKIATERRAEAVAHVVDGEDLVVARSARPSDERAPVRDGSHRRRRPAPARKTLSMAPRARTGSLTPSRPGRRLRRFPMVVAACVAPGLLERLGTPVSLRHQLGTNVAEPSISRPSRAESRRAQ